MRLNQKIRYGVACLYELAKQYGEFMDAEHLAQRLHIPPAYAHKVLQALAHDGVVIALKGVGYRLARPLNTITARNVIEALSTDEDPNTTNPDMSQLLERRINEALDRVTLAELQVA